MYYQLTSPLERRTSELFAFSGDDGRSDPEFHGRLWDALAEREDTGEFLDHTTPVATGDLSPTLVTRADYLPGVVGLPIFSTRFAETLGATLSDQLRFYPCLVRCRGQEIGGFVVAKTLSYLPLVDRERSRYRTLTDGQPILSRAAYRHDLSDGFHLARDVDHPEELVCSRRMVDLVASTTLRVLFDPLDEPDPRE